MRPREKKRDSMVRETKGQKEKETFDGDFRGKDVKLTCISRRNFFGSAD